MGGSESGRRRRWQQSQRRQLQTAGQSPYLPAPRSHIRCRHARCLAFPGCRCASADCHLQPNGLLVSTLGGFAGQRGTRAQYTPLFVLLEILYLPQSDAQRCLCYCCVPGDFDNSWRRLQSSKVSTPLQILFVPSAGTMRATTGLAVHTRNNRDYAWH